MTERTGMITFLGGPLTLAGDAITAGDKAPNFTVSANDMSPRTLENYAGKTLIIATVPSVDTPVCDMEVRRFNQEAEKLGENIQILTISCDLPFAQARWCGAAGVAQIETLSDHAALSFGHAYGVAIKELRLLTRAIFVINADGVVTYSEIVPEVTHEPDYVAALSAAQAAI